MSDFIPMVKCPKCSKQTLWRRKDKCGFCYGLGVVSHSKAMDEKNKEFDEYLKKVRGEG